MPVFLTRTTRPALFALALAPIFALPPVLAWAQSSPAPVATAAPETAPVTPGADTSTMSRHARHAAAEATTPSQRVEAHIAKLHAALHITPNLDPQWTQFAATMRDNAASMDRQVLARRADLSTMSALDDMQSYGKLADQHAEDMHKLVASFQTLYNAMSDEQKKVADAYFRTESMQRRPK